MADLKTTNIYGDAYINNKVGINTNTPATRLQIGQLSPTAATEGIQFGDDTAARLHRINSGHIRATGGISSATFLIADNYLQTNNNLIYPSSQAATQRLEVGNAANNAWIDGITIAPGGNVNVYNNLSSVNGYVYAGTYLQSGNSTIYAAGYGNTLVLNVGNASGNNWINGIAIAQGGNVTIANNLTVNNNATVTNDLTVNGNTYLGNANNDTVYVNDTIRIGATDSGDASLFFGEGAVAGSDYGARWYWDSGYTFYWYTRNNGTDTALFDYVTNDTSYINWRRHFHMQNKEINYNAQVHFNAGTRFVGNNTSYLIFRSDSGGAGGILVQDGSATNKGYTGYWDSAGGGILNNTGNWAVRYNFGNANSGGTLYGDWTVNANLTVTGITMTNLTGAYQNTTVYDSPRTQSATPSRGIRAPASSIQFTDSYAIAPSWTFRSTGDWPVPYGIGWGTGGESSGIFQRYHSNGSSFGDMIFYTGNDGYGAFSFRRHTWEGTTYFAAGSGELNTELCRIDWSGNVTANTFIGALSGNATTATTLQTGRAINGVSFNGSAAITVNGLNYNVNNDWLRENGDDDQFKLYGNSRTMIYRTDGNTNAHGGGGYAHIFYYGGSADANRMFIINTDGRLWSTYHGWLDTMSISGNAATATSADNIDGRPFVNTNSNSATNADSINSNGISYYTGGVTNFSGNATDGALYSQAYSNDWQHQIAGDYRSGQIALRGKNSGTWQSWRRVLDETNAAYAWNMNQYVRTTDNVTFGTVTATLSGTATNAGAINSDTGNVGGSRLQYWQTSGNTVLNPDGEWYNAIRMGHGDPVTYYSNTLAVRMTGGNLGDIYTRTTTNGVTGSWNRFWHNNNDGAGSGLDADLLDGLSMHTGRNNEANKVVRTDSNGYIQAGWINTPSGDMPDTESINKIYCSSDDYVRYKGVADFKQQIGLTYKNSTPRSSNSTDTSYWTGIMGWGATDWNSISDWGSGFVDSWDSPANRPSVGTHHVGVQAIHYTNGTARYGWQMANGGGNNRWWLRDVWGSSFSTWFEILTSTNYTNFSPSLTGTGASGTWAINITGNAATATTATNVTIANGSVTLAKIENITAYTILGNSNASAAATPAALSVATVATMLSGQTMNINGSSTSCSGNAATATTATNATVNANNTSAAWYPVVWHSGNTLYSSAGVQIYANGNYLQATYLNSSDNVDTGNISHIVAKFGDNYHRSATAAKVAAFISGQTMNINGSSTSCSGTATTATTANALNTDNSYTISGLTNNGTINIFPTYAGGYSYFLRMGYDNSGNYDYTVKRNGTTGFLEFNGTQTNYVAYYFAVSGASGLGIGVSPSSRLHVNGDGTNPAIRVDNGAIVTGVASNSKTFYGFMPISIAGTTKYIQLWN